MPKKKMTREMRGKLIESVMDELCDDAGRGSYEVAWDLLSDLNNVELINSLPIKRMREEGWTPYLPKELREEYELEAPDMTDKDEPKEEEDMKEEEQEKEAPETAADFGDDPKVRHSKGEHKKYSKSEPWEVRYRREKRAGKRAPVDAASFGDNPKIRHSKGEHTKFNKKEPWEVRYRHKMMADGKVFGMGRDTVVTLVGTGALLAFGLALMTGRIKPQ